MEAIKKRGMLVCGADTGVPGFSSQDNTGKWHGLDIAYCRALAAAVVGDPEKVRYVPTTAAARFTILQSGEIDVLLRDSTLTFIRNTQFRLDEIAVNFYAGKGFLVSKKLGVSKITELNGATICVVTGATLGLQGVPSGQSDAALALGMSHAQMQILVVLPQAMRIAIPGIIDIVVDLFKDTTLVSIVGLFELMGVINQSLKDPAWLGLAFEGYTSAAVMFFGACMLISLAGQVLERRFGSAAVAPRG